MKRKFIILSNVVITFILALFGVGCESDEPDGWYAYGTPPAYYSGIIGTVTGVNNEEVVGVEVTLIDDSDHECGPLRTDSLGRFDFGHRPLFSDHTQDTAKYTLFFEDVDGEKNGSYNDQTVEVTILRSEFDGETGDRIKKINVQLVTKKEDDEL